MIIGIDFNNTIQDQIGSIIARSNNKLTRGDFSTWDPPLGHKMGMREDDFLEWAWVNPAIQLSAYPFPGVGTVIDRLRSVGHTIKIITATCLRPSQVIAWLDQQSISFDDIVFVKDKSLACFDVLIDDSPIVIKQMMTIGRPIVKFELPWNQAIDCPGFSDWQLDQVEGVLLGGRQAK